VLDRVTARTSGAYNLALRWFTAGERAGESADGRLTVTQRAPRGASVDPDALRITTLLGEVRTAFEAPDGEYRLQVDLSNTRATTWANSVVFDFDERYPVEFIIGERLDPPGKVDEAALEGRVRLRGGPAHVLRIFLGTAQSSVIRSVTLVSEDGSVQVGLPLASFTAAQRRAAGAEASFHIVPAAHYEGTVITGHSTLAEQWLRYAWHPITADAIHEWQQTARVELTRDATFTFANLLYAETPGEPRHFALHQLSDGLVRLSGGEEALAGFGPVDTAGVSSDAQLVFLATHRLSTAGVTRFESRHVRLQASAPVSFEYEAAGRITFDCDENAIVDLSIGDQRQTLQLTAGRHTLGAPALTPALIDLDAVSVVSPSAKSSEPTVVVRALRPLAQFDAPLRALVGCGPGWLVGDEAGLIRKLDERGQVQWQFKAGGAINSLDSSASGGRELIVAGSEDRKVYALDGQGRLLWQREFELFPETYGLYAGLGQIRRVHIDDLDADGRPEIYVSPDNMHLHALDTEGAELWRLLSLYGPYTTYQAVDLYGDGQRVLVGGMSFNTCHSAVQVIDHTGHYIDLYVNDGWTSSLSTVWVGDIDADGRLEIAAGTNRGWVRVFNARPQPLGRPMPPFYGDVTLKSFSWAEPRDRIRWARHLGEPVRAVVGFAGLVVGAADNGFITAFDPYGVKCWHVRAHAAVTRLVVVGEQCYALGRTGEVLTLDSQGVVMSRAQLGGAPVAAQARDGQLWMTSTDGGLYVI
jgi:outer membrane protein assembly factor BamB